MVVVVRQTRKQAQMKALRQVQMETRQEEVQQMYIQVPKRRLMVAQVGAAGAIPEARQRMAYRPVAQRQQEQQQCQCQCQQEQQQQQLVQLAAPHLPIARVAYQQKELQQQHCH